PRSIFLTPARCSRSITSSALFGWSDTYASLREAWIAAPRALPPVLIPPTTSSRAVSISEIVPPFSLPTRARPAPAGAASDARIKKTEMRAVIAALSSNHAEIAHHHAVLVLQIVAVEHEALGTAERGLLRQREVGRQPQRLVRPQHHGVLHAEVGGEAPARLGREPARLAVGSLPAQHPEAEAVQVHGMGHRDRAVLDFPDFARAAAHAERDLVGPVRGLVDEKAGAFVEVEPHPPRRRLGL